MTDSFFRQAYNSRFIPLVDLPVSQDYKNIYLATLTDMTNPVAYYQKRINQFLANGVKWRINAVKKDPRYFLIAKMHTCAQKGFKALLKIYFDQFTQERLDELHPFFPSEVYGRESLTHEAFFRNLKWTLVDEAINHNQLDMWEWLNTSMRNGIISDMEVVGMLRIGQVRYVLYEIVKKKRPGTIWANPITWDYSLVTAYLITEV